jgi:hypothetical protein
MSVSVHKSKKQTDDGRNKQLMKISFEVSATPESFDFQTVNEWICFEDYYSGFAVKMGAKKWKELSDEDMPDNVIEGVWIAESCFNKPDIVTCVMDGKWLKIYSYIYENESEKQTMVPVPAYGDGYEDDIPF